MKYILRGKWHNLGAKVWRLPGRKKACNPNPMRRKIEESTELCLCGEKMVKFQTVYSCDCGEYKHV